MLNSSNGPESKNQDKNQQPLGVITPIKRPGAQPIPNVFEYKDYRKFLGEWLVAKKSAQPSYSGALFARKAGLNSHSFLGMVIRGSRNLSATTIRAFARALHLDDAETGYFEKLVLFNQSPNPRDKEYYLDQLTLLARGGVKNVFRQIQNLSQYIGRWYVLPIRELVNLKTFEPKGEWISKQLGGRVSPDQAEEAWQLLLKLGAVKLDSKTQRYIIVEPNIEIDPGTVHMAVRRFHLDFLDVTRDVAANGSIDQRELSSITMAVAQKDLPRLREKLRQFRLDLNREFASEQHQGDELISVNTQMLILSHSDPALTETPPEIQDLQDTAQ